MANNDIKIGYNIDDFFYLQTYRYITFGDPTNDNGIDEKNTSYHPYTIDTNNCLIVKNKIDISGVSCSHISLSPNGDEWYKHGDECFTQELCNNKKKADEIYKIQNTHSGSGERYLDSSLEYNYEVMKTMNLGIGNFFLIYFIIYNLS